jgi:hypothetical protein
MGGGLAWREDAFYGGLIAETDVGTYWAYDTARQGYGGYGAFFRPAKGRARPRNQEPLGNFQTIEQARERCERHYRERSVKPRPTT